MLTKKCARLKRLQRLRKLLAFDSPWRERIGLAECAVCATIELFAQDPVVISPRSPIQLTVDHVDHQITVVHCCCYWSMVVDPVVISPRSHTVDCRSRRSPDRHSILLSYGGGRTNVKDSATRAIPLAAGCLCTAAILECKGI
jgi:hypothetical protein